MHAAHPHGDGPLRAALTIAPLLVAALAITAPPSSAAPAPPSCQVVFDVYTQTAHPTATTASTLTFTGFINVSLGSVSGSRLVLIESSVSPSAWGATVTPTNENVTGTERINFTATVVVPAAEPSSTRGLLTVLASFQVVPGVPSSTVECSDQANVVVAQYYGVVADAITPRIELSTGTGGEVATLLVHNNGNGRDSFTVNLDNAADVQARGILTNLPLRVTVEPGAETNVTFTVNATSDTEAANYDLVVVVASTGQPGTARTEVTFTIVVKPGIVEQLQNPTTLLIGLFVFGTPLVAVLAVWALRRRKAAREARRQLQRVRRAYYARAEQAQDGPSPSAAVTRRPEGPPKASR